MIFYNTIKTELYDNNEIKKIYETFEDDALKNHLNYDFYNDLFIDIKKNIKNFDILNLRINGYKINNFSVYLDTVLLDLSKEKYNLLEKIVYDITMNYINELNEDINLSEVYTEFWLTDEYPTYTKGKLENLHFDKSEIDDLIYNKTITQKTTGVTYLVESFVPNIITSIDNYLLSLSNTSDDNIINNIKNLKTYVVFPE